MSRRWGTLVVGILIGLGAGAAGWSALNRDSSTEFAIAQAERPAITATVEQRDLSTITSYPGTLGFSNSITVRSAINGTLTAVANAELIRGDVVFEIDGEPTVLLYGELPLWRNLDSDSDDGADVLEMETNLVAMGFTAEGALLIDGHYDEATAVAVESWETAMGFADPDGSFEVAQVVIGPGQLRLEDPVSVGSSVQGGSQISVAMVTERVTDTVDDAGLAVGQNRSTTEEVTVEVDPTEQDQFVVGQTVNLVIADGTNAEGTVVEIGDTARRVGNGANATLVIDVVIEPVVVPGTDLVQGPVTIEVPTEVVTGATAVPVRALLTLSEGGYAVEVVSATGTHLVGIDVGLFSDGFVEVTGDLSPGDQVVVPS